MSVITKNNTHHFFKYMGNLAVYLVNLEETHMHKNAARTVTWAQVETREPWSSAEAIHGHKKNLLGISKKQMNKELGM